MKDFFFDLDGTLLGKSRVMHPASVRALNSLHERGCRLFICSGRSPAFLKELLPQIPFDGFVGCAGGAIVINGKTVYENDLDRKLVSRILRAFDDAGAAYSIENSEGTWMNEAMRISFKKRSEERIRLSPSLREPLLREAASPSWKLLSDFDAVHSRIPKISFTAPSSVAEKLFPELEEYFHIVVFGHNGSMLSAELDSRSFTKADGMRFVLDWFGGQLSETAAFGDSMNDLQMIEAAGLGVVSELSPPELLSKTPYTFADPDRGGIAAALQTLRLI